MAPVTFANVGKIYPDGTRAVIDLNLEIEDGEFVVFVGPSGCGKTTALRMVAGLEEVTDGELRIGDQVVNDLAPQERDIAMVFQNYALYPHMSVFDNIAFPLESQQMPKAEVRERVDEDRRAARAHRAPQAASTQPLRRSAPARRDGARARAAAAGLPHGRAALEPRREAARADARGDHAPPGAARRDDDLRHARPGRGDDDGRPDRRHAQGRAPAAGRRPSCSTTSRPTSSSRSSSARRR